MSSPRIQSSLSLALLVALASFLVPGSILAGVMEERIDLFDPRTGAFLGSERTYFGPDGRRLRLENTDAAGSPTLLFFLRHDELGRESAAFYFESDIWTPYHESFSYSESGDMQTTTYYWEPDVPAERTEVDLDDQGREFFKRYYRADGTQYGEEDVLWYEDGKEKGWDFRFVGRDGGASFLYDYADVDGEGEWLRRTRSKDRQAERVEVRTRIEGIGAANPEAPEFPTPAHFAPGLVSTEASETSPSFSADGRTLVFARYGDDWTSKEAYIAYLGDEGWEVESLEGLGMVYNLAISPDAGTIFFSRRDDEARSLFRVRREAPGSMSWGRPENLTDVYGIVGTYPCLTGDGSLLFFDSDGSAGSGIYVAAPDGEGGRGFSAPVAYYVAETGTTFDAYAADPAVEMLVTRCFDDACESGPTNGIWRIRRDATGDLVEEKLPNLPYGWGGQPVDSLGIFVYTDGEDILALPLSVAGLKSGKP